MFPEQKNIKSFLFFLGVKIKITCLCRLVMATKQDEAILEHAVTLMDRLNFDFQIAVCQLLLHHTSTHVPSASNTQS